jgi:hypothetical protein
MRYAREFWHDLKVCVSVAYAQWRYIRRHLRHGGNPDVEF